MRRTSDHKQRRDSRNGNNGRPSRHIKTPPTVRPQRPIEPLLLDETERPQPKLQIRRSAPDSRHDGKNDPALHVPRIPHAVVQRNRQGRGIDKHQKRKEE